MNNTFNINRFGKLLALDGRKYFRNFGITLAILSGLTLVLWLLTIIFDFHMVAFVRFTVIYLAVFLAIIMVPAKAFGDINLPREGVRFAILPASNLEKYLSYAIFCLLTPVLVLLGSWALDSLLTLLPFGGFDRYITHWGFRHVFLDFISEIGALNDVGVVSDFNGDIQKFLSTFGPGYSYAIILSLIFNVGLFMFGNLLFKTHKTGKTLAVMIGVSYVLTLFMQFFMLSRGIFPWMTEGNTSSMNIDTITDFTRGMMSFSNILHTIVTVGLYIGIFFKLKTQKY